ncbi:MAG TPA: hypothetical protein PKC45_06115, partial [Gemmatales bacterium]|nr:hypothetical protein [Gemmatales bacterium]
MSAVRPGCTWAFTSSMKRWFTPLSMSAPSSAPPLAPAAPPTINPTGPPISTPKSIPHNPPSSAPSVGVTSDVSWMCTRPSSSQRTN